MLPIFDIGLSLSSMPTSTIFIALIAIGADVVASLARVKLSDMDMIRRINREVKQWNREYMKAIKENDQAKLAKLKRKEKQIKQLQAKLSYEMFKPTLIFMLPFLLLWYVLIFLVGAETVVAVMPIQIPLIFITVGKELQLFWWYLISSIAFSTLVMKLFHAELE